MFISCNHLSIGLFCQYNNNNNNPVNNYDPNLFSQEEKSKVKSISISLLRIDNSTQENILITAVNDFPNFRKLELNYLEGQYLNSFIKNLLESLYHNNHKLLILALREAYETYIHNLRRIDFTNILEMINKFPLHTLTIADTRISDTDLIELGSKLKDNTTIRNLDLVSNPELTPNGYREFFQLVKTSQKSQLSRLEITLTTVEGIRILGDFCNNNPRLKYLAMYSCVWDSETVKSFSQFLKNNKTLESLFIESYSRNTAIELSYDNLSQILDAISTYKTIKSLKLASLHLFDISLIGKYLNRLSLNSLCVRSIPFFTEESSVMDDFISELNNNQTISDICLLQSAPMNLDFYNFPEKTEKILERNKYRDNLEKYIEFKNALTSRIAFPNELQLLILEKIFGKSILEIKKVLSENQHLEKYWKQLFD